MPQYGTHLDGEVPLANPDIGVGGHVLQVVHGGEEVQQPVGGGKCVARRQICDGSGGGGEGGSKNRSWSGGDGEGVEGVTAVLVSGG